MNRVITGEYLSQFVLGRAEESHKGDYGHALLVCGCDRMPGAASLATGSALRSGCGLVTLHSTAYACQVSAAANPSAILSIDPAPFFSEVGFDVAKYDAVGVGPGLGRGAETGRAFARLVGAARDAGVPMVLDADALNIISENRDILSSGRLPAGSVMTPHDGELARLISWTDAAGKLAGTQELADRTGCVVVSKGWHTRVFVPGGVEPYENTTGNPGMAKGGSGDVLTGLVTGLIARGYATEVAAIMGVWIHGYAGDSCTEAFGTEAYSSRELIDRLWTGFKAIH